MMITNLWNRIVAATKAEKPLWVPIDQGAPLASDASYVRIFISEMWLETKWKWFSGWYPAVEAAVKLTFGDQPATVITRVAKPPEGTTDNAVLRNYEILPLTPFNGGTLELQAALMALQGQNYLGSAIKVLEDFSSLVAAPLGQALAIAEKVSNGLDEIVQATNGSPRLPYHDTFVGAGMGASELKPGYVAAVRAQPGQLDTAKLSVKDGALLYDSAPFRKFDYLLLRIDGATTRDDYAQLSSIKTAQEQFITALQEADDQAAMVAERQIKGAVFRCADLARWDRPRVWDAVDKELNDIKNAFGLGATGVPSRSLDDIVATWAVPIDLAGTLPDQGIDIG
jgi:hypothetical protein